MNDLEKLGLEFCGFWDRCFFTLSTQESGLIVKDKFGNQKYLSWFDIKKMISKNLG